MQCINCPHLKVEEDWFCKGSYQARCYEESVIHKDWKIAQNGKFLYNGVASYYGTIFDVENLKVRQSALEHAMEQLKNQKKPPKWCPLLKVESEVKKQ